MRIGFLDEIVARHFIFLGATLKRMFIALIAGMGAALAVASAQGQRPAYPLPSQTATSGPVPTTPTPTGRGGLRGQRVRRPLALGAGNRQRRADAGDQRYERPFQGGSPGR